jgi:hypothetical protein
VCGPLALPIAAAGLAAAGTLVQGYSAMRQGNFEAGVSNVNAQLERQAAEDSLKQGQSEKLQFWRKVGQIKGQQNASMAANGIDVGYGTAANIAGDTQSGANEDAKNLYGNIDQRTRGFIINNWNDRMQAKAAKAQGKAAFVGSIFQAGSSLLGGFQQQAKMRATVDTGHG